MLPAVEQHICSEGVRDVLQVEDNLSSWEGNAPSSRGNGATVWVSAGLQCLGSSES